MPAEKNKAKTIAIVGKFIKSWDEEYIAEGFENIGCEVLRIPHNKDWTHIQGALLSFKPDILLFTKWEIPPELKRTINDLRQEGMKTVCWIFDLYWGYHREYLIKNKSYFRADFLFTTDGGHDKEWKDEGINHHCVRQGIRTAECYLEEGLPRGAVFIGSDNPVYPYRQKMLGEIFLYVREFKWYGRGDTDEVRGTDLNKLFARTKIVVGDSVYSPHYWSNRVVETLGRGGFLIHPEVEGIKEAYPHLITYQRENITDLKNKIIYYMNHEFERKELVEKNWKFVLENYTVEKSCQKILDEIFTTYN